MDILDKVTERLESLGYIAESLDEAALRYDIDKTESDLKARTNLSEVPEGLLYVWIDMAAGLFLYDKKAVGALGESYDFAAAVKSVSEGDTSVTFGDASTVDDQFNALLAKMINPSADIIARYRRMVW